MWQRGLFPQLQNPTASPEEQNDRLVELSMSMIFAAISTVQLCSITAAISISSSNFCEPFFGFREHTIPHMIPSRTSQALTEWTRPSAFQHHPGYIDDEFVYLNVKETHFYKAGNHHILHELDSYILHQRSLRMIHYIQAQTEFWKFVGLAADILQWKLLQYTRQLPEHNTLAIPTSEMMQSVDKILEQITEESYDVPQQFLETRMKSPVCLSNRLLEEVKHTPPFIPKMTRRHSFP